MGNNRLVMPILGALLAAVVGGALWALIAELTNHEIGIIAWAIGGLAGYAVYFTAGRNVSAVHQAVAVIASVLGIILGKYFILAYSVTMSISGIFDSELLTFYVENISKAFEMMDLIFLALAVITAWQLPSKLADREAV
ncbi:hypothetical protein DNH61_02435 [Paenibacillus sambharensis]|uniref:Uncharacterized protein n=1 Tax=Paenibacillus sambharensis TaxID=1803190 RepID=A0A2W1LRQ0_9BACL|nr:hypothetical protein [Paenibacillus sambharensis]PZD97455.1 hypothetical protein DNH61_02435 [Paenibacillus sambharensis]